MTTETMTIHRGLCELKVLISRINKVIDESNFCTATKASMRKLKGVPIEDFKKDSQSALDQIKDLMARYDAIKRAISESNAKTTVEIAGKSYTVAEAIYMNQYGLDFKQRLYLHMSNEYSAAIKAIEKENAQLSDRADRYIANTTSNKESMDPGSVTELRNDYIERETMVLIDGIGIKETMNGLAEEIDKFKSEVDSVLSTSNATTTITISY